MKENIHATNALDYLVLNASERINYRVERGRIIQPKICSNCKSHGDIGAHHLNYNRPNEVMWLCRYCHQKLHFGHDIKGKLIVYDINLWHTI